MTEDTFLVPDYYPSFHCKGGSCRHTCCSGWSVTLSQEEYFRLESLDVSPELKEKIEAYVGPLPNPDPSHYAKIGFTYEGECPLLSKERLCRLQMEKGEKVLSSVCRYYPRGPRVGNRPECSISDSCEAVVETLFSSTAPLTFQKQKLSFDFEVLHLEKTEQELQLQQEAFRLLARAGVSPVQNAKDIASLLLGTPFTMPEKVEEEILKALPKSFSRSMSLSPYLHPGALASSSTEEEKLLSTDPQFQAHFSRLLTNSLFFLGFPHFAGVDDLRLSSYVLYFLVRFYEDLAYPLTFKDWNSYIDYTADFFRMAEHSNFPQVVLSLLFRIEENEGLFVFPVTK